MDFEPSCPDGRVTFYFDPLFRHSSSKTQVFEISSTPVNLRPGCDFRALCEEGNRNQKHVFRSRSVAKTTTCIFRIARLPT